MSEIVLVLAVADNGVIGKDGAIPWHISDDLKRFNAAEFVDQFFGE